MNANVHGGQGIPDFKDWALRSRFVRFYRAGNRCEWCGVHNYSLREDTGAVVVLTAAHVYDKRPEACGLSKIRNQFSLLAPRRVVCVRACGHCHR